ncbi:MAG: CinA family protein, partial [Parvularculaceae bacterium]|nr:CinA family protein [Parvularculaceae bacterium]
MTEPHPILDLARRIVDKAGADGMMIATAESCTGGMVSGAITDVPGASAVFERGFVTYSNEAKSDLLGVAPDLIRRFGAVSREVAIAMAAGALSNSRADVAVSVTGIAGPTGGSTAKPVGLVWFALAARSEGVRVEQRVFSAGDRAFVRQ